jgi:hypothetical protein
MNPTQRSVRSRAGAGAGALRGFAPGDELRRVPRLLAAEPQRYGRDAARWLRDLFDHYGSRTVERPLRPLHPLEPLRPPVGGRGGRRDGAHRATSSCRPRCTARSPTSRGSAGQPPGAAARPQRQRQEHLRGCLMRAMEDYSAHPDEGALYRFNWVFPKGRGDGNAHRLRGAHRGRRPRPATATRTSTSAPSTPRCPASCATTRCCCSRARCASDLSQAPSRARGRRRGVRRVCCGRGAVAQVQLIFEALSRRTGATCRRCSRTCRSSAGTSRGATVRAR